MGAGAGMGIGMVMDMGMRMAIFMGWWDSSGMMQEAVDA